MSCVQNIRQSKNNQVQHLLTQAQGLARLRNEWLDMNCLNTGCNQEVFIKRQTNTPMITTSAGRESVLILCYTRGSLRVFGFFFPPVP